MIRTISQNARCSGSFDADFRSARALRRRSVLRYQQVRAIEPATKGLNVVGQMQEFLLHRKLSARIGRLEARFLVSRIVVSGLLDIEPRHGSSGGWIEVLFERVGEEQCAFAAAQSEPEEQHQDEQVSSALCLGLGGARPGA
ncbi:hypothetical protein [Mesorhizobium sp. M1E.F.Ca.ET.041.01.1.1]|uniref:hypothetical protein n=1 Tax=Mesorhizobium sp. M1E.F.Ca.ET.041.01.1.1 TaxID=2496759 RepID=UPI001AECD788|nr:hypothetical protein [Mesorhizobium sp. M1E.F.Ca.ET.041.01.1.1]